MLFETLVGLSNIGSLGLQALAFKLVKGGSLGSKAEVPVAILNEAYDEAEKAMTILMANYGYIEDRIVRRCIDRYGECQADIDEQLSVLENPVGLRSYKALKAAKRAAKKQRIICQKLHRTVQNASTQAKLRLIQQGLDCPPSTSDVPETLAYPPPAMCRTPRRNPFRDPPKNDDTTGNSG